MVKNPTKLILQVAALAAAMCLLGCSKYYVPATTPLPTTPPPADTARVFFVKPGGSWGKAEAFVLKEDQVIGYLANRQAFFVDLPAGEHLFMSVTSNSSGIQANLAGGKTYYVRLFSTPGVMSVMLGGSEDLHMVPIEPGTEQWDSRHEWVEGAQLVELNLDKAEKWEAKYAEKNAQRLENFRSGKDELKILAPEHGE